MGNGVAHPFQPARRGGGAATYDPARPGGLSETAGSFAAGVLRHMPALCALTAPSPVSYLRLVPQHWSAAYACLGERNREAAVRICSAPRQRGDPAKGFNLEYRLGRRDRQPVPGARRDRAGRHGRGARQTADAAAGQRRPGGLREEERARLGVARLPATLHAALQALAADAEVRGWFTPAFLQAFVSVKAREAALAASLPPDELCRRYADVYRRRMNPPAVTVINEAGASPIVLLCEHASNLIPARYGRLGLTAADLERHIAYDIGAAAVARLLSARLDAVLALSGYSRLLIDCNRPLAASTSIPERSEATDIPGNIGIDVAERTERDALYFAPFRERVAALLEARLRAGKPTVLIGMHSFTPVYLGVSRVWHAGFLYARAQRLGRALIEGLRAADPTLVVGDNEPYQITDEGDYTVPYQGDARGIQTALIEVRQDLIAQPDGQHMWASRLADVPASVAKSMPAIVER